MKKYITPEINVKIFMADNIITTSGTEPNEGTVPGMGEQNRLVTLDRNEMKKVIGFVF